MAVKNIVKFILLLSLMHSFDCHAFVKIRGKNKTIIKEKLSSIKTKLPSSMIDVLKKKNLKIRFKRMKYDDKSLFKELCFGNYEELKVGRYSSLTNTIYINNRFTDIQSIDDLKCRNKVNVLFEKTIIHELMHAYDALYLADVNDNLDYEMLSQNDTFESLIDARGLLKRRVGTSLASNSPDSYELTNTKEFLAVNFEFFVLDQEYKCRRPRIYKFLSEHFQFYPYENYPCESSDEVFLSSMPLKRVQIKAEDVYEIHYLLADKGTRTGSGFGHSMFRLVTCSPETLKEEGFEKRRIECLSKVDQHLVVNYRANTNGQMIHPLKGLGLFGNGYQSQLYIVGLEQVVNNYTRNEFRDLISYPMLLSRKEIERFVVKMKVDYWGHVGDYKYITKNCATESLRILNEITNGKQINNFFALTPNAVLNRLRKSKLIVEKQKGVPDSIYFFPSAKGKILQSMKILEIDSSNFSTLELITKIESYREKHGLQGLAIEKLQALYHLHSYGLDLIENDLFSRFKDRLDDQSSLEKANMIKHKISELVKPTKGYGIPLKGEIRDNAVFVPLLTDFYKNITNIKRQIKTEFVDESNAVELFKEKNKKIFRVLLKRKYGL